MATFHFRAVGADGRPRTGTLHGDSEREIARELIRQGLTPLYVGAGKSQRIELKMPTMGAPGRKDVLFFTQELSTLLNAGVPLDRALSITAELTEKPQFRFLINDVLRLVKGGKSLADALAAHPQQFSELYVNMVRAGEASGSLAQIFERLSQFEESRDELRNYIISSMVYPVLLLLVGIASVFVLMNYVVPKFAKVFADARIEIPGPTLVMIQASRIFQDYTWLLVIGVAVAVVAHQSYVRTPAGRLWWDTLKLRIPVLGDALRKAETARFARSMATLIANSVPLVQSIQIARNILDNKLMSGSLDAVATGIKRGEGVAGPIRRTNQFPPLAGHLLMVGEETGALDTMFLRMADIYEAETKAAIKRFTALFEPLVILIMGIVVGALILTMLLGITSINEVAL
jgi:general secretion pathway protein F